MRIYLPLRAAFGVLTLLLAVVNSASQPVYAQSLPYIAHAGGGYQNWQYTNTLQALNANHDYFDLFEIDLSWTSDGHLVCLHDWQTNAEWIFGQRFEKPVTLEAFEALVANHPVAQNCTLETLVAWLHAHPSKTLVTDIKTDNLEGLTQLAAAYGEGVGTQIIVQIYHPDEYEQVRALGYDDLIWTLYRYAGDRQEIVAAAEEMTLRAVTMPRHLAEEGLAHDLETPSYVHTVNTQRELQAFTALGIQGIYTDWLPDPALENESFICPCVIGQLYEN